jgi:hypothetical protein
VKADDAYRELAQRRRSLRFIEEVSAEKDIEDQGQAFLFIRDLKLGILPLSSSLRADEFSVAVEPQSTENQDWVRGLLGERRSRRPGLEEIYVDFVEGVVHDLASRGEARYEIVQAEAAQGSSRARATLLRVPPGRLFRLPGGYVQMLPKSVTTETGRRWAHIPTSCLWRFTLPTRFGSPRSHRRRIRRLAALKHSVPPFILETGFEALATPGYDFSRYRRAFDRRTEALLRDWGTVMSMPQLKDTSEYYYIRRRIQWHHSQALVREHILRQLNQLLDRRLRSGIRIVISGLPSATEIAEAGARLDRGEIGFAASMDLIRI